MRSLALLAIVAGCAGLEQYKSVRAAGERHGNWATVVGDYREALLYEVPPQSPDVAVVEARLRDAFGHFVDRQIGAAQALYLAGQFDRADAELAGMLVELPVEWRDVAVGPAQVARIQALLARVRAHRPAGSPSPPPTALISRVDYSYPLPETCANCVAGRDVDAQPPPNLDLHATWQFLRASDPKPLDDYKNSLTVRAEGFSRPRGASYVGGATLELGFGFGGGFAYDVDVFPAGVGFGTRRVWIAVAGGAGLGGVALGRVPFGWQVPIDAHGSIQVSPKLSIVGGARTTWTFGAAERKNGASLGDEFRAVLGVGIGPVDWNRADIGSGPYFGIEYRELMGTKMIGFSIGSVGATDPVDDHRACGGIRNSNGAN